MKQPNNEPTTTNKEMRKNKKNKEIKIKKKRKSKRCFEDQHWIHVQQEFSQFVQNLSQQQSEEQSFHTLTKRKLLKKE